MGKKGERVGDSGEERGESEQYLIHILQPASLPHPL